MGELAGDRDRGHAAGAAAIDAQVAPAGVQSALGAPGQLDDPGFVAVLAALQGAADARWARVVVGGLDEQPARVHGAGLGDSALAALVAAGVFGWDQAKVGAERRRAEEALEVADFGADAERRQRVEA